MRNVVLSRISTLALAAAIAGTSLAQGRAPRYSIEQATSDKAQLHTIAFSGLAFLTGDFGACTFIPPGKVCDYFGFQYMRDIDAQQAGHNPKFLNRVAGNVMKTLNAEQKKIFVDLALDQAPKYEALAKMRLPIIRAFWRERQGDRPAGTTILDKTAVAKAVADLFAYDGEMSYQRAKAMGAVARSLTPDQKEIFARMKFGDFASWPEADEKEGMRDIGRGQSHMFTVAYMTYMSEFYSWYAGSLEADTYFCPERHGTYFGGFYMKDMPAMGQRDFNISTSLTGDSGRDFLATLTPDQRTNIEGILPAQKKLMDEVVVVRRKISAELRKFLAGGAADHDAVISLSRRYGELDGEMSAMYAIGFARVGRTLTADQKAKLMKLRNLDGYRSAPYYIYSEAQQSAPQIGDTDRFFTKGGA